MSYSAFPVSNGLAPDGDPIAVPVTVDLTATTSKTVNFLIEETNGSIDNVQTLFVDNADNAQKLTLTFGVTNQRIVFPANAQGYVAVLAGGINVSVATTGAVVVPLIFINVPMPGHVWSTV